MAKLQLTILREEVVRDRKGKPYALKHATWIDTSRYTGDKLVEIRKRKGVGRPPKA